MKKVIYSIAFASILILGACSNNKPDANNAEATPAEKTADVYACPMKCSDYKSDKPGKCPECEMDLEKINPS